MLPQPLLVTLLSTLTVLVKSEPNIELQSGTLDFERSEDELSSEHDFLSELDFSEEIVLLVLHVSVSVLLVLLDVFSDDLSVFCSFFFSVVVSVGFIVVVAGAGVVVDCKAALGSGVSVNHVLGSTTLKTESLSTAILLILCGYLYYKSNYFGKTICNCITYVLQITIGGYT